jgi:hypothetical protein
VVASLAVAAMLVASLAGCGDSSDDEGPSATDAWADDVCSSVQDWTGTLSTARDTLSDTSSLSADSIRSTVSDVSRATETFVSDLKNVGAPDTEAGGQAEQELQTLSANLAEQAQVIEDATSKQPAGLDSMLAEVSTVTGAVGKMVSDAQTAVANIRGLDGAQELEDAFTSAPTCKQLTSSRSPSD